MIKLFEFVYSQLDNFGSDVFDKTPPPKTPYPFIQYRVDEPYRNSNPNLYMLTVDIWDRNDSTYRLENLAKEVDDALEELLYTDECLSAKFKRQSRLRVEDIDDGIKRRQLTYQIRVFDICEGEII